MLSTINFLFLIPLAIISWVILCYLNSIKELHSQAEIPVHFDMVTPMEDAGMSCTAIKYDMYFNIICLLTCVYGLLKITNCTENFVSKVLHAKINIPLYKYNYPEALPILRAYGIESKKLEDQISALRIENAELRIKIANLEAKNRELFEQINIMNEKENRQPAREQKLEENKKENNVENDMNTVINAWPKYAELLNDNKKAILTEEIEKGNPIDLATPKIVSNEQLQMLKVLNIT